MPTQKQSKTQPATLPTLPIGGREYAAKHLAAQSTMPYQMEIKNLVRGDVARLGFVNIRTARVYANILHSEAGLGANQVTINL